MPSNQTKTNFAKTVLGMSFAPWVPRFTKYAVGAVFFCLCLQIKDVLARISKSVKIYMKKHSLVRRTPLMLNFTKSV